jgi:hypothetical protein
VLVVSEIRIYIHIAWVLGEQRRDFELHDLEMIDDLL